MRLAIFFSKFTAASKKKPRILIQVFPSRLLPAFIGSDLLATTERSATSQPIGLAFPYGLYLTYLIHVCGRRLRRFPRSSAHSIPSILTLITSMSLAGHIPFVLSCKLCLSQRFPRFLGGSPCIAATSGSPHSGLDFACRPFRFSLARDTLSVLLLRRGGPLLRLRHFKG